MIRPELGHLRHLRRQLERLHLAVARHRVAEPGVAKPVRRVRRRRGKAAQELVLALGAGLEQRQLLLDAAIDAGVVGRLEVQAIDRLVGAPVATVECAGPLEEQRAGDAAAAAVHAGQERLLGQILGDEIEEARPHIGAAAVVVGGVAVPAIQIDAMRLVELTAAEPLDALDLRLGADALLAQLLAAAAAHLAEEVVVGLIAGVVPVKLHAGARDEAQLGEAGLLLGGAEQPVDRGALGVLGELAHRRHQHLGDLAALGGGELGGEQDAGAGGRGAGRGDHQLGVIGQAGAHGGVGPAEVEDVLAVAVGLEKGRHGAEQAAALLDEQVDRLPAAALLGGGVRRIDRAGLFEGAQEAPAQEGRGAVVQPVPVVVEGCGGIDGPHYQIAPAPRRRFRARSRLYGHLEDPMSMTPEFRQKIEQLVNSDAVVLFMKGNKSFPQCGFSASVVGILNTLVSKYTTVNILADVEMRTAMKEYSDWPTFPQLYVGGEFVGGADIVRQMHEAGELAKKVGSVAGAAPAAAAGADASGIKAPKVTVTARAAKELTAALSDGGPGDVIHITITPQWEHQLDIGPVEASHVTVKGEGITLQLDAVSAGKAEGLVLDFIESAEGAGFKIDNPNRPASVKQISPKELKVLLDGGKAKVFDVRTPKERAIASIAGSTLLDDEVLAQLEQLAKDTPIALFCHHGGRSQAAAEHLLRQGFRNVHNVSGGIEAWSRDVDPSVPRY